MRIEPEPAWPELVIALYELPDGNWSPILSGSLIAKDDPRREPYTSRPLAAAMTRAREWQSHDGLPVLIQPLASRLRVMNAAELDLWGRARPRPVRRTLAGIRNAAVHVTADAGGYVVSYECAEAFGWGAIIGPFDAVSDAVAIARDLIQLRFKGTGDIVACPASYAEIERERQ